MIDDSYVLTYSLQGHLNDAGFDIFNDMWLLEIKFRSSAESCLMFQCYHGFPKHAASLDSEVLRKQECVVCTTK